MLKIKTVLVNDIQLSELKDGQLGIITKWGIHTNLYVGRIVQWYKNNLIALNAMSGDGWPDAKTWNKSENYRVRVLQDGEELVVCNEKEE